MEAKFSSASRTIVRLQHGSSAAASVLLKIMADPGTPTATKVRAAECILNRAERVIEIEDVEARLAELERSADQNKPDWRK